MKSINLISLLLLINLDSKGQNPPTAEAEIKECIYAFARAGDERNTSSLDTILHENFRVVANRFPSADKTTILTKETYIQMLTAGKIGGVERDVKIVEIDILTHIAIVKVELTSSTSKFTNYISLILNGENKWQLIADMPYIENK